MWTFVDRLKYSIPRWLHRSNPPVVARVFTKSTGRRIDIYCFHTAATWYRGFLPDGTGGSEEAVTEVARILALLGYDVTVYNNCGRLSTTRDNVRYRASWLFFPFKARDIVILWRSTSLCVPRLPAKKVAVWLQDVPASEDFSAEVLKGCDSIISVSQFQTALLPKDAKRLVYQSMNGISPIEKPPFPQRQSRKCIYTSAPDRGLECLLKLWPTIRELVPDATLSTYYGWEAWQLRNQNPRARRWRRRIEEMLTQPGIEARFTHLSTPELEREYLSSSLWLYPTEYPETACISAMKAQAFGAFPVTTTVGALAETVQWGAIISSASIYSDVEAQAEFVMSTVELMLTPPNDKERSLMRDWAQTTFSWTAIVAEWEAALLCK